MKTMTIRLPEPIAAEIETESRERRISKSDVVRERIERAGKRKTGGTLDLIADLIRPIEELPTDLSSRTKHYLKKTGYGKPRR